MAAKPLQVNNGHGVIMKSSVFFMVIREALTSAINKARVHFSDT